MRRQIFFRALFEAYGRGRYKGSEQKQQRSFRVWLWREVKAGRFPAPVSVGPNRVAWWEDEVQASREQLRRVRYAPTPTPTPTPTAAA